MPAQPSEAPAAPRSYIRAAVMAIDTTRSKEFADRFAAHGFTCKLHASAMSRNSYWDVANADRSLGLVTGFDQDLERVLARLDAHEPHKQALDTCFYSSLSVRTSRAHPDSLTGGPFCVVCGEPGGLPCPKMVARALHAGICLHFTADDARIRPQHVHPGRCRKRLKALLGSAAA